MPGYTEKFNTGLPLKFTLTNGKFTLQGGTKKVDDNLSFMLSFIGWFRIYKEDFVPDILWLLQKPTSVVESLRSIILGRLLLATRKHVPFIKIDKISLSFDVYERKVYFLEYIYRYNLDTDKKVKGIKYIQV